MTREEQIKQAAQCATNYGNSCNNYAYLNFIEGAEWADSHPKDSCIEWRTENPDKVAYYFVQVYGTSGGFFAVDHWNGYYWHLYEGIVAAWSSLDKIKPYKEDWFWWPKKQSDKPSEKS